MNVQKTGYNSLSLETEGEREMFEDESPEVSQTLMQV